MLPILLKRLLKLLLLWATKPCDSSDVKITAILILTSPIVYWRIFVQIGWKKGYWNVIGNVFWYTLYFTYHPNMSIPMAAYLGNLSEHPIVCKIRRKIEIEQFIWRYLSIFIKTRLKNNTVHSQIFRYAWIQEYINLLHSHCLLFTFAEHDRFRTSIFRK